MVANSSTPEIYSELGIGRVINGRGWMTRLGGSIMEREVVAAMSEASTCYVNIHELNVRAGDVIATHTGAEAGLVTAGAAAGMVLQTAACMTGQDRERIESLPETTGIPDEILIHSAHRFGSDQCYRLAGATLVEWGNEGDDPIEELAGAITENTAAVAHIFGPTFPQPVPLPDVIGVAHRHDVPVIVDAAAMLPPKDNLTKFIELGADLVTFSGGKGLRGPQSSGILCGRGDLVEAARLNMSPHAGVGRPSKVCQEEIIGLLVALERFVERDHESQYQTWVSRSQTIVDAVQDVPDTRAVLVEDDPSREGPQAVVSFDPTWPGRRPEVLREALIDGEPPIYVGHRSEEPELWVTPVTLQEGDENIVADRLRQELLHDSHGKGT